MSRRGENIRKRKDGRWEGRYYTKEPMTGKSILHSVYARTYGEVKEKLSAAKMAAAAEAPKNGNDIEITFGVAAEEWLAIVCSEKKHSTYMKYRIVYEKHIQKELAQIPISELDSETLNNIFRGENKECLSDSLQKSISCVLHQILSHTASRYHFHPPAFSHPRHKAGTKPVEVMDTPEQARLLHFLYHEMDACKLGIVVCISTGLRLGEICSLKWTDIDLEGKLLHVNTTVQRIAVEGQSVKTMLLEGEPKSIFSKRKIPLSDELVRLLFFYQGEGKKYVVGKNRPMEPRTYQNKFQSYLRDAGIEKKNFHALRHTFATNCINSGADVKSLSEILGHSDVKITLNRYVHPTFETKRQHMNSLSAIYGQIMGRH